MPVDSKQQIFVDMEDDLEMVDALWGGTKTMREAGVKYLPKEPAEEQEDYQARRDRSTLTNVFKKTINGYAGRIFDEPARIDSAPAFAGFVENVDYEGRDFHRFVYDLSRYTLKDGLRFILIDAPSTRTDEAEEGDAPVIQTPRDEKIAGIRPYWVEIDVRAVRGVETEIINGQITITQFRMEEIVSEPDPEDEFKNIDIVQMRVIEPNQVRLYRKADGADNWVLADTIATSINYVPVVPVFGDRVSYMKATPPLLDIAWLNVEHWQKGSDQSNILHVARVPILHWAGYGAAKDENGKEIDIVIGPNSMAKSANENAKLEYVEHSGKGIEAGRQDLQDIEKRMIALGGEFVLRREGSGVTATENVIDESGDLSELEAFAYNLIDSLTNAMVMTADMMNIQFDGEVFVNTDIGIMVTPVNIAELVKVRAIGDISREQFFEILNKEWGTDLDASVEGEKVDNEKDDIDRI